MSFGTEWMTVASNAAFLLPSIKAGQLNRNTRSILFFLMMLSSAFHHLCTSGIICIFPAIISRKMDFFFAQLLIPVTALYLIDFPLHYAWLERWLIWGFIVALFCVEVFTDEPFWMQAIVVGLSISFLLIYWAIYAAHAKDWKFPPYDWAALSLGIWLSASAVSLFGTQGGWPGGYDWVHSVWHIESALGQYWILCSRPGAPRNAALDATIMPMYRNRKSKFK